MILRKLFHINNFIHSFGNQKDIILNTYACALMDQRKRDWLNKSVSNQLVKE